MFVQTLLVFFVGKGAFLFILVYIGNIRVFSLFFVRVVYVLYRGKYLYIPERPHKINPPKYQQITGMGISPYRGEYINA